ncbi:MAG: PQQ-dependent sugar dehydrogenase [Acidimicrobiales bacterium]|nr:PQQ-dependent sugar dehydrogenase [Acidimicrobiales bacterium]
MSDGLTLPWDLAFIDDGAILFTERPGRLKVRFRDGRVMRVDADLRDLFARGESGLLGLELHPDFATNRRFYTCQGHTGPQIQVIGWTLSADATSATRFADPLVGGIPLVTGRHGGCRVRFGPDDNLWIATGDAAKSSTPQSLASLGGKVLRVDPDTGAGVADNPFANSANRNARLIYSYGHRNLQGLDLRPGTDEMWTVEHGPSRDDEINRIVAGGNYGWDPGPGYNEGVPMTDLAAFPNAVEAQWSTGSPTLAMSGGTWITGRHWGPLQDTFAVASLKNRSLRFFDFTAEGEFLAMEIGDELSGTFGRLRTPVMAPNGLLYVTTSNGSNDRIIEIAPTGAPRGSLDSVRAVDGRVRAAGWAIDPNRTGVIPVRVVIDGEFLTKKRSGRRRPDVGRAFPDYGARHGFVAWFDVPKGTHEVCIEAVDVGKRRQGPVRLGCRTITV